MFGFYDSYFLFFGLSITYYGFIIACAIALGIFLACKNGKLRGLKTDDLLVAACYVIPIAIIGARAYYVLFTLEEYTSFWDVFKIWDGGLAVYGSVIGGAIGVLLYCLIHKRNFFDIADVIVPSLILGQAVGRIGCYFSGCCYGIEVTNPAYQWFPLSVLINGEWHLSTFFYESLWNFMSFIIIILLLRVFKIRQRGAISASYLILYGIGRAWIEGLRGDSLYLGSIKVSQLLSIILIVVGLGILLFYYLKKSKVPTSGKGGNLREISLNDNREKVEAKNKKLKVEKPTLTKSKSQLDKKKKH